MKSALYEGRVTHRRLENPEHGFSYRVTMPLLYLDELEEVFGLSPLWSLERPNVVSFRRADFLPPAHQGLPSAVRSLAAKGLDGPPEGQVAMLGHVRTWGWLFNPITLYYVFDSSGAGVESLVAQVTNTPWHETHPYVLGPPGRHVFDKELHVSPFFGMDQQYRVTYTAPGDHLGVRFTNLDGNKPVFEASLTMRRRPMSRQAMRKVVTSYPLMTTKVSAAIYRQAYSLWRKGAPFVRHPRHFPQCPEGDPSGSRLARAIAGEQTGQDPGYERDV